MKAIEMFEKLDGVFSVDVETTHCLGYGDYYNTIVILHYVDSEKFIFFDGFDETYRCDSVNADEHKAITQQMKELGWLE
jgi:hypothetical protein